MNHFLKTCMLAYALLLGSCATQTDLSRLGDREGEERRLLVTFTDRSINRVIVGNSQDAYRTHGQYGNSGWSEAQAQALAERHHLAVIAQWPVTELGVSCMVLEVPAHLSLQDTIANLQQDAEVELVQPMQAFEVLNESQSNTETYTDPYLNLQTGFQSLGIAARHKLSTGRGVRIALIDSGVDIDHPDLKGQIRHNENLAPLPANRDMADWHGTAVAGVLSARPNNGIGIVGVAPDAEVLAFRACWPKQNGELAAHCNSFTLALALNQALRMNSQIINLSLAGPQDPLLQALVEKALAKGIIVVAAIAPDASTDSFPASLPGVIAVGRGGEQLRNAVIAPGLDVLTTVPHDAYDFMTGSSFATPHVAGLIALMLERHPDWRTADVQHELLQEFSGPLTALDAR